MRLTRALMRLSRPVTGRLAELSGLIRRTRKRMLGGLTILMYHRVLPDDEWSRYPLKSIAMPATAFREQAFWLARHCRVLPVGQAIDAAGAEAAPGEPLVAITFDDGYRDNYDVVAQILREAGLRATFFVIAGLIGTERILWSDRLAHLWTSADKAEVRCAARLAQVSVGIQGRPPRSLAAWLRVIKTLDDTRRSAVLNHFERLRAPAADPAALRLMNWDEVVELAARGHEIGSHTLAHRLLTGLHDNEVREEVLGSAGLLAERLGTAIRGLCYPFGAVDHRSAAAALLAGYEYACTTVEGINCPGQNSMALKRLDICPERVTRRNGRHSELRFRAAVNRLRHWP